MKKDIAETIKFESFRPGSCKDGILVTVKDGTAVDFTTKKEKYRDGLCKKATVEFDNVIYSKADKKKNATSITYMIYYGKISSGNGTFGNETGDEYENGPPVLLSDVPDVVIEYNGSYSLNLSEYFSDSETLAFTADVNSNISISISGSEATLSPLSYPYNGTHTVTASDGEYTASSTFNVYAKPPPVINQTGQNEDNGTALDESISVQISLTYPENNTVIFEGNHTFLFSASNGTCSVRLRNQSVQSEAYIEKGYYWWGVSCEYMNRTYLSGKNYLVVMPRTTMSINYSNVQDLANASNISVENPSIGKLVFDEPIDLTVVQEMERYINISRNRVEIDTQSMQHLNKSAIVTLYNIEASNPVIKQDGRPCPEDVCRIISYGNGVLVFRVGHFTVYEVGDAPQPEPEPQAAPQASGGGGSSGGSGNFAPSPESSFGGAVTITRKNQTQEAASPEEVDAEEQAAPTAAQPSMPQEETVYEQPVSDTKNENYITGSVIRLFVDNAVYIVAFFVALLAGIVLMRKKGINASKRKKRR
ncbi:MAG: hypothetical protein HYT73_03390 [Candidatus Aenigmarchaeota archaeon]|nr:hypothetical protein [Candidatus Aenigmarchaeota archaeon]